MTTFTEKRLATDGISTISELRLDGQLLGYTLEPGPKSFGHPRKPAGRYPLQLRKEGGIYESYRKQYSPDFFVGIPHIIVPGRTFIEVHVGNTISDTQGCSLLGATYEGPRISASQHYEVRRSKEAFLRIYPKIRDAILAGASWWETIDEGVRP